MSEREAAICRRVREIRLEEKWDMPDFAKELGISRDRLASYEYMRAPVRYWLAQRLFGSFTVNPRWLATGKRPMYGCCETIADRIQVPKPRALFSEIYDQELAPIVEGWLEKHAEMMNCEIEELDSEKLTGSPLFLLVGNPPLDVHEFFLDEYCSRKWRGLPPDLQEECWQAIRSTVEDFLENHRHGIDAYIRRLNRIKTE